MKISAKMFGIIKKSVYLCTQKKYIRIMTAKTWESLPVEVRKFLVQKRIEASMKYQGSMTCEKYGVFMKD